VNNFANSAFYSTFLTFFISFHKTRFNVFYSCDERFLHIWAKCKYFNKGSDYVGSVALNCRCETALSATMTLKMKAQSWSTPTDV